MTADHTFYLSFFKLYGGLQVGHGGGPAQHPEEDQESHHDGNYLV
jgi:hypothetical protein